MAGEKIAIVGVGPVGSILAAYLVKGGFDVTAVDILQKHLDAMRAEGLVIEGKADLSVPVGNTFPSIEAAAKAGRKFDIVYICVKAVVVPRIAGAVPSILREDGTGISFQNGLDSEAGLLEVLGPERTLRGVINYAGNLSGMGKVRMTFFNPPNYMGAAVPGTSAAEERAKKVAALMDGVTLTTEFSDNIQHHVWEKAIRNAALAPVSAVTGMNMKQVMDSPNSLHIVEKLLSEAMDVSAKAGFPWDRKFYDDTLAYYRKAGPHIPSMLEDVRDGRVTEIGFLNGRIAEYGEKHGVDVPYNREIANLVNCIDELAVLKKKGS
ncbi:MAG: ketopantoate reductase family protein [Planctomycetota bacterium]|jgi:2-dehydropantoate 2-reductase